MGIFFRFLGPVAGAYFALASGIGVAASPTTLEPAVVEVDLSPLSTSERAALARIIHAARRMDALYIRQVWHGTSALLRAREPPRSTAARAELAALNFFKGPWDNDDRAFIPGVPKRPIGDFYPQQATKQQVEAWLTSLSREDRQRALDPFTAIRTVPGSHFVVVPYSHYYASELHSAARDLLDAAALTHELTLQRYLQARAKALLTDDYYASDVAFVGLEGPIDVVLGPYEVDDDTWFGVKTAFEASIGLVNEKATKRIAQVSAHLQELEDHLPLAPELRGRKLAAAAPVLVLDVIYHGGLAGAGGAAAGYGLPNDLRVLNAVGARTGTYANIIEVRYQTSFAPIADAVLANPVRANLRFEDILDEIMMVRVFDSLGPQVVTGTNQPIADALQGNWAAAEQIRSMLLSLWGHRYLINHGYRDAREASAMYAAFLVPALARLRAGLSSSPAKGSTYVLNHLLEAGAIHAESDRYVTIDGARADTEVKRAASEIIPLMAEGNAGAVDALLRRYVVMTPQAAAILARIGPAPPLSRFIYRTADQLDPP